MKTKQFLIRIRLCQGMGMIKHETERKDCIVMSLRFNAKNRKIDKTIPQTIKENIPVCSFFITVYGNPRTESFRFHLHHYFSPTRKPLIPGEYVSSKIQNGVVFSKSPALPGSYFFNYQCITQSPFRQKTERRLHKELNVSGLASSLQERSANRKGRSLLISRYTV